MELSITHGTPAVEAVEGRVHLTLTEDEAAALAVAVGPLPSFPDSPIDKLYMTLNRALKELA